MKQAPASKRFAAIAIDVVVFGIQEGKLCVLLQDVDRPPHYKNIEAFPGGVIESTETAEDAVKRHLKDKVELSNIYTEQLYTFSALERDKRNRVISIAYIGFVQPEVVATYKHEKSRWVPVDTIGKLAYDHNEMLTTALGRLRGKLSYTTVAQYLLSAKFTLTELQSVYEIIHHTDFDKRNFRKKMLALDIVKETGEMQEGVKNRPAALYIFKVRGIKEIPLL